MQMYEQSREVVYFYSVFSQKQKKRWVSFPNVSFELYAVLQLGEVGLFVRCGGV